MPLLVPLGDGAVQCPALRAQHQVVGYVSGDDVGEHPGQFRLGRLEQDEVTALEAVELVRQGRAVSRDGVDVGEQPVGEAAPDDTGHLQRQLLRGGQAIDAGEDHPLHRVGKRQDAQVGPWGDLARPVGDGDGTGVTQRVGQLLAEERVPTGVLADELGDQPRNRAHP